MQQNPGGSTIALPTPSTNEPFFDTTQEWTRWSDSQASAFSDPVPLPSENQLRSSWKGPKTSIVYNSVGKPFLSINGNLRPFILINPNLGNGNTLDDWKIVFQQIEKAKMNGIKLIEFIASNRTPYFIEQFNRLWGEYFGSNSDIYFWMRDDLWVTELVDYSNEVPNLRKYIDGAETENIVPDKTILSGRSDNSEWIPVPYFSSLNENWLVTQKRSYTTFLNHLNEICFKEPGKSDCKYPPLSTRIIGFRSTYQNTQEWFLIPFYENGSTESSKYYPWTDPEKFSLGDYRNSELKMFQKWGKKWNLDISVLPSIASRIESKLGEAFSVRTSLNQENINAIYYRLFQSDRMSEYQNILAGHIKKLTDQKTLHMSFGGYYYSLATYNGLQHTSLDQLIRSQNVDAISAPYSYEKGGPDDSRNPGSALIGHGPMDSPELSKKLWVLEDDTRPWWHLPSSDFVEVHSPNDYIELVKRNVSTAMIHHNGIYFLDLNAKGWWNPPSSACNNCQSTYNTLWNWISAITQLQETQTLPSQENILNEIAVFVDHSMNLHPEFGIAGKNTHAVAKGFYLDFLEQIAKLGAPIRYYLVSDLEILDVSKIKLCIFLNSWKLTTEQRNLINFKLKNNKRTLYFQYASGLYKDDYSALVENVRELTGISDIQMLEYEPGLKMISRLGSRSYGHGFPLTPSFFLNLGEAEYVQSPNNYKSLMIKDFGSYKVIYSAHPLLDIQKWNEILSQANVFQFSSPGIVIDGSNSEFIVHRAVSKYSSLTSQLITFRRLDASAINLYELQENGSWALLCTQCKKFTLPSSNKSSQTAIFQMRPLNYLESGGK